MISRGHYLISMYVCIYVCGGCVPAWEYLHDDLMIKVLRLHHESQPTTMYAQWYLLHIIPRVMWETYTFDDACDYENNIITVTALIMMYT